MTRKIVICVSLLAMAAGLALSSSNNVKEQEDQLAQINRDIAGEQERIRVLTAEWHTLKTPERLEELTARHLTDLHPSTPKQVATLASLLDPLPVAADAPAPVSVASAPVAAESKPSLVAAAPASPAPTANADEEKTEVASLAPAPRAASIASVPPRHAEVQSATPARTAPHAVAQTARATAPVHAAAKASPDSIEEIIAQTENPFHSAVSAERAETQSATRVETQRAHPRRVNDELSELIERQPAEGVVWASAGGNEVSAGGAE